jgi:hypothetical protein
LPEGWELEKDKPESPQFIFERRKHPRFLVELPVEYRRANDSRVRPGHTINFSEDGLMISVSEQMEIGEQLEMKIYFSSGSSLITIEAVVKIAWVDVEIKEDGYYRFGVRFVNISPVDMERLTGFLNLYADPNQAPVELKSPAGGRLNPRMPSAPERPGRPPAPNPPPLTPLKRLLGLARWAMGKGKS